MTPLRSDERSSIVGHFHVRRPDGTIATIADPIFEHGTCKLVSGDRCEHGYRMDAESARRRDGDGCVVVAVDAHPQFRKGELSALPATLRDRLRALKPGASVEALLDDGRVVLTTVRGEPWMMGNTFVVPLENFNGGFNLGRCRLPRYSGWSVRLPATPPPPAAEPEALELDPVEGGA